MTVTPTPGIFKKIYSAEDVVDDIESLMKDSLNLFIDQMNTDRPTPTDRQLDNVDDDAYFFHTLNDTVANLDPFIFIYESGLDVTAIQSATAKEYSYTVALVRTLGNESPTSRGFQLIRYREVLERLFEKSWDRINSQVKLQVTALPPSLLSINSIDDHIGVGVTLSLALA